MGRYDVKVLDAETCAWCSSAHFEEIVRTGGPFSNLIHRCSKVRHIRCLEPMVGFVLT